MPDGLARDGLAPAVTLVDAVVVEVSREQPPGRLFDDDGTVHALLEWVIETRTWPLPGTVATGPGFYRGVFAAEHRPALEAWFEARG